ncbi:MAG TPA: hypothetical protein VJB93_02760, partial [Patescibacteria group bacterium]|nr:hypothetical protein [Patescibacteria group bacterium]
MKRTIILSSAITLILATHVAVFWYPQTAQAQLGGVVTDIGHTAVTIGQKIADVAEFAWTKGSKIAEDAWKKAGAIAYRNGMSYFLGQFARDAALKISGGCSGQEPCFKFDKNYWTNLGDSAFGDMLDTLAKEGGFLDNGLCEPFDPVMKLNLTLNVGKVSPYSDKPKRKPKCSFSDIKKNIKATSLKNLVEVDVKLNRTSTVYRYKSEILDIIKKDDALGTGAKNRLLNTAEALKDATDELSEFVDDVTAQTLNEEQANKRFVPIIAQVLDVGAMLNKNYVQSHNFGYLYYGDRLKIQEYFRQMYISKNICPESAIDDNESPCATVGNEVALYHQVQQERAKGELEEFPQPTAFPDVSAYLTHIETLNRTDQQKYGYVFQKNFFSDSSNDSAVTAFCAGGITDAGCKEQIQEYLNRLDGWFKELYDIVDTMNDDRRKGALKPTTPGSELADVSKMFNPESNPIGSQLKLTSEANDKAAKEVEKSKYFQSLQGVTDSITSTVSGVVKTPSTLVNALGVESLRQSNNQFAQYTGVAIADAVGIFTNTLVSQLVKKFYEGPGLNTNLATAQQATQKGALPALGGVKVAQKRFASLAAPAYKSATAVDTVTLLARSSSSNNGFTEYNENIIDSGFAEAIKQELTIQEAIEKNLIHADWKFGYEKKDIEPKVGNGYPYRSLVLLRHYRIIPVTWELAAEYINTYDSPKTMGELIEAFDDSAKNVAPIEGVRVEDNATGRRIFLPSGKDYTRDFYVGQSLIFVPDNNETARCATRVVGVAPGSATILSVTDLSCGDASVAVPIAGKIISFSDNPYFGLINPQWVLKAPQVQCAAQGAGEQITSRQEEENKSDPKKTKSIAIQRADYCADEQTCVLEDDQGNCKRFGYCTLEKYAWKFGDQNKECRPEYASCETFKDTKNKQSSYLKSTLNTTGCKDDSSIGCREYLRVSNPDIPKNQVPQISNAIAISAEKASTPLLGTAFSSVPGADPEGVFWCTIPGGARCQIGVGETSCEIHDATGSLVHTCSISGDDPNAVVHINNKAQSCKPTSAGCQRYVRVVPKRDDQNKIIIPTIAQMNTFIDRNADQGDYTTEVEGFRSTEELFLNSKRAMCRGTESIGCQAFVPQSVGNPVTVYAKLAQTDQCVAECVGFNDYIETPTALDPGYKTVSFIPIGDKGGNVCNAASVGCEEFTNVNSENLGTAEAREYYTNIRWCANTAQTTSESSNRVKKRYFVWEGADIFGFQLRSVDLLKSNINANPCTHPVLQDEGTICNDTAETQSTCTTDQAATNPDCREFIDSQGNSMFMLQSKTVPVSNDCRLLRRTKTNDQVNILPSASAKCSSQDNMCRRYEGPKAGNVQLIFKSDFNAGIAPWEGGAVLAQESGPSGEITSMAVSSGSSGVRLASSGFASILQTGKEYSVTLLYKISSDVNPSSSAAIDQYPRVTIPYGPNSETDILEAFLIPDNEWHTATLGPVMYKNALSDQGISLVDQFRMYFSYPIDASARLLVDQIQMSTRTDVFYRVRDSWAQVPQICIDQQYKGCSAYSTRMPGISDKAVMYMYKFSQPCPETDVGCEALINTNNNESIEEEVHFEGDDRLMLIPKDFVEIVKVTPQAQCQKQEMGCMLYAEPVVENKQQEGGALAPAITRFTSRSLIELPDQYDRIICSQKSAMCEQYTVMRKNQDGKLVESGNALFKAPQGHECEFNGDAWVIKGTSQLCPVVTLQTVGASSKNSYTQPAEGYAGLCPQAEASCTEVREEKDNISQFITIGTGLQNGPACTEIDVNFGSCRQFRTFAPSLPREDESRNEYWQRTKAEGVQKQAESIRVKNDRVCGEWLECRSSAAVTGADGKERQVCFDRFACRGWGENGECATIIDDKDIPSNFTYSQPAIADSTNTGFAGGGGFEEFTRRSGLSSPGLRFNTGETLTGRNHPIQMSVAGDSAPVLNFDFEKDVNDDNLPDGWIVQKPCEGSCSLDTTEVKSGVRALRIGSVATEAGSPLIVSNRYSADTQLFVSTGATQFTFTGETQSYAKTAGTVRLRFRFFFAGNEGGKYAAPNDETREGWRAGNTSLAGAMQEKTITLQPSEKQVFSFPLQVPKGEWNNTFVVVDAIKETEGVVSLRNMRFVPYNNLTRVFSFEQNGANNTLGNMPNASSQPNERVDLYKSVGCTNCKLISSDGGQAFQIGKITATENVCESGAQKGNVCTKPSDCGGARCVSEKAKVAVVFDDMKANEEYFLKGRIRGTGAMSIGLYANPNEDRLDTNYDDNSSDTTGRFISGLTIPSSGNTWKTFEIKFSNVRSLESRKLALQFLHTDAGLSGRTPLVIDDLVFSNTSRLEYSDSVWWEQNPCDGKCDLIRGSDLDVAAFPATSVRSADAQTGMSVRVSGIRGGAEYVISGWVNTKNMERLTNENDKREMIQVAQFSSDQAPPSGKQVVGVDVNVGTPLAVFTTDIAFTNQWQFFAKEFKTVANARSLRIDIMQNIIGSLVFDDIQIRPVLRVAGETARPRLDAAPSCRLYPSSSALQCDSVDDRGQYVRGWKGFCMERDPANPAVCIQWYPVDVIKDETNIFTKP